jgi:hypothetical protein
MYAAANPTRKVTEPIAKKVGIFPVRASKPTSSVGNANASGNTQMRLGRNQET